MSWLRAKQCKRTQEIKTPAGSLHRNPSPSCAVSEISTAGSYSLTTKREGADVITGSQIRTARSLLGWDRRLLARACKLRSETLVRAESVDGEPPITIAH